MQKLLGTGFDASQPVIQGLRLAFVDPKVWFKIYVGGVKDIVSGNVDAFTWYTQFMSSVSPTDLAKMREMNIAIDELPEYLEILNASSFKGLSEKVNRQLDKKTAISSRQGLCSANYSISCWYGASTIASSRKCGNKEARVEIIQGTSTNA